jgi:uncharacterized protein
VTGRASFPFPKVTPENRHFWAGGERGELVFLHCPHCDRYVHPPVPRCPFCKRADLSPRAVSGRASVYSFTVNHQAWTAGLEVPYVIAIVAIDEQPDVRLTTNLVDCRPEEVRIGMPVKVRFEHRGQAWIPLFAPAS